MVSTTSLLLVALAFSVFTLFQMLLWSHLDAVDHTPHALRARSTAQLQVRPQPAVVADAAAAAAATPPWAAPATSAAAAAAATIIARTQPAAAATAAAINVLSVGQWKRAASSSTRWHYRLLEDAGTRRGDVQRTAMNPPDATRYDWVPRGAATPLPRFTSASFCAALKARGIRSLMMVGDSITFMQFQSLHALLGDGTVKEWPHGRTNLSAFPDHNEEPDSGRWKGYACGGQALALAFVRNDCLCTGDDASKDPHGEYRTGWGTCNNAIADSCFEWIDHAAEYDVLLLNAGAHFHDRAQYERAMRASVARLEREGLMERVIFRTTPAGHPRCTDAATPFVGDAAAAARFVTQTRAAMEEGAVKKFGWTAFRGFNEFASSLFTTHGARGVLDVAPMTALRPDGHRAHKSDCLHYYLPGVPDWWNFLLFETFLKLEVL